MNYNIDKYIKNEDNSARFVLGMDSRNPCSLLSEPVLPMIENPMHNSKNNGLCAAQ